MNMKKMAIMFITLGTLLQAEGLNNAIFYGDIELAKTKILNGENIEEVGRNGMTPIMYAIQNQNEELVKLLIEKKANLSAVNEYGRTPLIIALETYLNGKVTNNIIVKLIVEGGANVNQESKRKDSKHSLYPLAYALKDYENVRILIEKGANPNIAKGYMGNSLLIEAIAYSDNKTIKYLIENNADIYSKSKDGATALNCVRYGQDELTKYLIEKNVSFDYKALDIRGLNLKLNTNKEMIDLLLKNKVDLNMKDEDGKTAIMHCEKPDILLYLIKNGANISDIDNAGMTVLMNILRKYDGNSELVKILIDNKININQKDKNGENALFYAIDYGNYEAAKLLIENGIETNVINSSNQSIKSKLIEKNWGDLIK